MELVLVAAGGAVGAVCRYLAQTAIGRMAPSLPWGTLAVNLAGCFAIGVLYPQLSRMPAPVRPLVVAGFLGGLTTMSSYAVEVVALQQAGRSATAAIYGIGGVAACVLLAAVGYGIGVRAAP